jgi:mono/diheme cytochrome c family protein
MRSIVVILALLIVLGAVTAALVYAGTFNVAATAKDPSWRAHLFEVAKDRSIDARLSTVPAPPALSDAEMIRRGLIHFNDMCVVCHGGPGIPKSEIGKGLNPEPPNLTREASEQSPERLYWVLKHGIKMTGMPAFGPTHSDAEIWTMVAFLKRLPSLDADSYRKMLKEAGAAATNPSARHEEGEEQDHEPVLDIRLAVRR